MNIKTSKCIEETIKRIKNSKNHLKPYSYISYFCSRYSLTMEEEFYIREQISKYIDKHLKEIFNMNFTINGIAC